MKKVMLTLSATVAAAFFSGCICTETTTVPEVKIAGEEEAAPGIKNVEKKPAEPKPAEKKPAAEARPAEVKPAEKETAVTKPVEKKPAPAPKPVEKKPAAPAETPLILTDTVWTPVSLYNQGDVKLTKGTTVWFRIHPGKDIVGMSGVNRFSAPAEIPAPGKLKFGLMISTLMAGPEANMKYESLFLNALNRTKSYEITGRELKLFGADGKVLMNCVQAGPGVGEDASSK
ncbi:META domain-containing protein [uncultured Victivallis sp.]|uniref:META domain-containing protein n=1 Tax=uncultured Victivallis sp. TaxID=354118 RepID=UPI0025922A51|nr:META domain-containing protein [uncultured Victivallis sp.]